MQIKPILFLCILLLLPACSVNHESNVILLGWDGASAQTLLDSSYRIVGFRSMYIENGWCSNTTVSSLPPPSLGWIPMISMQQQSEEQAQEYPLKTTIFHALKQANPEIITGFISNSDGKLITEGPLRNTSQQIDFFWSEPGNDSAVMSKVQQFLEKNKNKRFFLFIYFESPEMQGKDPFQIDPSYRERVVSTDMQLINLQAGLKTQGIENLTSIYFVTNHYDGNATTNFFCSPGKEFVKSSVNEQDITSLMLSLFQKKEEPVGG